MKTSFRVIFLILVIVLLHGAACFAEQADEPPAPVPVEAITLETESGEYCVPAGQTLQLLCTVQPPEALQDILWSVDNSSVASIDQSGLLTGIAPGRVTVTASARDESGICASVTIEVQPVLIETITLTPASKKIAEGGRCPVAVTIAPENATNPEIAWTSSDSLSAWIETDDDGLTLVAAPGAAGRQVTITASAQDESKVTAQLKVSVTPPVENILISCESGEEPVSTIEKGDSLLLSARMLPFDASDEIVWISENGSIASIESREDGRAAVTGMGGGKTVIHALAQDGSGVSADYELFVRVPVESVSLNEEAEVFENRSITLTPTLLPADTTDTVLRWSSDKPSVASVNAQGTVWGVSLGTAHITARSATDSSLIGECTVTVTRPVSAVTIDAPYNVLGVNGQMRLSAATAPSNATDSSLIWRTGTPEIASVDENGVVTAFEAGTAVIHAIAADGGGAVGIISIEIARSLESIALPEQVSVMPGETFQLELSCSPYGLDPGPVEWNCDTPSVASVTQTGLVSAVQEGNAVVTARTQNGCFAQCVISVSSILSDMEIRTSFGILRQNETLEINLGETVQIIPDARPVGIGAQFLFKSSNQKIAPISPEGRITASRTGSVTVSVTARDHENTRQVIRSFKVRVIQPVTSVLLPETIEVLRGRSVSARPIVTPAGATYTQLTWYSLDPSVVQVSQIGKITGLSVGETLVTAMSHNRMVGKSRVIVREPAQSLSVSFAGWHPERINPGDEFDLAAVILPQIADQTVKWSSSNPRVFRISQSGRVCALKTGRARITAAAADGSGVKTSVTLSCEPAVTGLKLNKHEFVLFTNGTGKRLPVQASLKAKITPSSAAHRPVVWKSSDPSVAQADESGNISARSDGAAKITASTENGKSDSLLVHVYTLPSSVSLVHDTIELIKGASYDLASNVVLDGSDPYLSWKSSKPKIAKVDAHGIVTARKAGSTAVRIRTRNGLSVKCIIRVVEPSVSTDTSVPADNPSDA